jgi:hypothetical protein
MDGWADYEGKVTRHEDLFPKDNTSLEEEAGFSLKIDLTNKTSMESKGKISIRFNTRRGSDKRYLRRSKQTRGPVRRI